MMLGVWWFVAAVMAAPDVGTLDAVLQTAADRDELVAAIRVVDGDTVLLDAVYGDAPADPVCRIGSVSKSFTAATVHALADEGLLSIDDPIGVHLPRVQAQIGAGPTLRQLMHHTGGLSNPAANPSAAPPVSWEEQASLMLGILEEESPPGEEYAYSNFGYTLLSATIATVSGVSLEAAVRARLLDPLGLADTGLSVDPVRDARLIAGRVPSPLGLIAVQEALPRWIPYDYRWPMGGAGAFTSSPRDLVRWAEAIRDGAVLSDAARQSLLTPALEDYAAGWVVKGEHIWHNGALEPLGTYAYLRWSPYDRVVVAFCGTPGVGVTDTEWAGVIEDALEGEAVSPPVVSVGPMGWFAAASTLRLHWMSGGLGLVLAGAVGRARWTRLGMTMAGVGMAVLGFGLSHALAGLAAGLAVVAVGARRIARGSKEGSVLALLVGGSLCCVCLGVFTLVLGWSALLENMWALASLE